MSRARDLADLGNNAGGLETLTVSDITDLSVSASNINSATNQITDSSTDLNVDSNTFVVDKSENKVGVGKTPTAKLDVKSKADNADDSGISIEANSNTNRLFQLGEATGQTALHQMYSGNTEKVRLHANGDTFFNGGNVGIGSALPSAKLSIVTAEDTVYANVCPSVSDSLLGLANIQASETANDQTQIQFNIYGGTHNRVGSVGLVAESASNRKASLVFTTDEGGSRTEKMRITGDGNVLIGTTSFGHKLSVDGNIQIGTWATAGSRYIGFGRNDNNSLGTAGASGLEIESVAGVGNYNQNLHFWTHTFNGGSYRRMTIKYDGTVLIGSTNNVGTGDHKVSVDIGTTGRALGLGTSSTGAKVLVSFVNGNGTVGDIRTSGSSTSYVTSSDYRLKENVTPLTGAIDRLNALKPSRFNFVADPETTLDGFLAHEVSGHVPEAVTGQKDAMTTEEFVETEAVFDEEGNEITPAIMGTREVIDPQGIDQSKLVPLLVASVQELSAKVTALENA